MPRPRALSRSLLILPLVLAAALAAQNRPPEEQSVLVAYRQMAVAYSLLVKNGAGEEIFANTIGDDAESLLLAVDGRFIDVKLPSKGLGVKDPRRDQVGMEEADSIFRVLQSGRIPREVKRPDG